MSTDVPAIANGSEEASNPPADRTSEKDPAPLTFVHLVFGILLPLLALVVELTSAPWAEHATDPIPTPVHVALVAAVPIAIAYSALAKRDSRVERLLLGVALGTSLTFSVGMIPFVPLALIGVLIAGFGFLPLAPFFSAFVVTRRIASLEPSDGGVFARHGVAIGAIGAVVSLLFAEYSVGHESHLLTRAVSSDSRVRAGALAELRRESPSLRALDTRNWNGRPRSVGIVAPWFVPTGGAALDGASPGELHYRIHGTDPDWATLDSFSWFGSRPVRGPLKIERSTITGVCDAGSRVVEIEWEIFVGNDYEANQEVELEFDAPVGGVPFGMTLDVAGVAREAVIDERTRAASAYRTVVNQKIDPALLVETSPGRFRLSVFPVGVEPRRVVIRWALPLHPDRRGETSARVTLPRMVRMNTRHVDDFDALRHVVDLSSTTSFVSGGSGTRYRAELGQDVIANGTEEGELRVAVPADVEATLAVPLRRDPNRLVVATLGSPDPPPERVVVAIHASSLLAPYSRSILDALAALRESIRAVVVSTDGEPLVLEEPPKEIDCAGGHDQMALLLAAAEAARHFAVSRVVWIAAPQGFAFVEAERPDQKLRSEPLDSIEIVCLQLPLGTNRVLGALADRPGMSSIPFSGDVLSDLRRASGRADADPERLVPTYRLAAAGTVVGSSPTVPRESLGALAAAALYRSPASLESMGATSLAKLAGVVTLGTAALVLETDAMYAEHDIDASSIDALSTRSSGVGSEAGWITLTLALVAAFWLGRSRRSPA